MKYRIEKTKGGVTVTKESQNGILDLLWVYNVDWDYDALNKKYETYPIGYYEIIDLEVYMHDVGIKCE